MGFGGLKLTNFGLAVLAKAQAGKALHLTRVGVGDGMLGSGSFVSKTALISEKMSLPIDAIRQSGNTASVIALLSNSNLEQEFYFKEMGIYARDPDTNQEGLYVYDNCLEQGELIGDKNSLYKVNFYMRLHLGFSQTVEISFTPSDNPIYVLYEEFDGHVRDYTQRMTAAELLLTQHGNSIAAHGDTLTAHGNALTAHGTTLTAHAAQLTALGQSKVDKSTAVTTTLTAAGWTGASPPYAQTLYIAGVTPTNMVEVLRPLPLTEAVKEAWDAAGMADGGQAAGAVVVHAWGDKPAINLPCRVIVRRDL